MGLGVEVVRFELQSGKRIASREGPKTHVFELKVQKLSANVNSMSDIVFATHPQKEVLLTF